MSMLSSISLIKTKEIQFRFSLSTILVLMKAGVPPLSQAEDGGRHHTGPGLLQHYSLSCTADHHHQAVIAF